MPLSDHQGLRDRLGIPADASLDDDGVLAALDQALAARPATNPPGTVLMSATDLEQLQVNAQMGVEARAQQIAEHRNSLVTAAINDGRIAPARRDHFAALHQADPEGTETLLASLPAGMAVPLEAKGYTGDAKASSDDDDEQALYDATFGRARAARDKAKGA